MRIKGGRFTSFIESRSLIGGGAITLCSHIGSKGEQNKQGKYKGVSTESFHSLMSFRYLVAKVGRIIIIEHKRKKVFLFLFDNQIHNVEKMKMYMIELKFLFFDYLYIRCFIF